jgi:N4-gp56 family major capsid protein
MAETTAATGLTVQQWDDKYFVEHTQENRFAGEMGKSQNSIIQVKEDLTKAAGESLTFALVNRATGAGVENGATLEGNEEALDSRSFKLTIKERANGIRVTDWENQISAINLRQAAKSALKTWSMEDTRDRIITALNSKNGVAYATASEVQKDAWLVDNADRVLFGDAKANNAANDHSAALTTITAGMTLGTAEISLMKRIAKTANPKIRPVSDTKAKNGREYYTLYVPSLIFRDLQGDTAMQQAQREVSLKPENSQLFKGGDLMWDGVIIKEIEDIATLGTVGAAGTVEVGPAFLCGAQAIGYGIARRWKSAQESFDYGRKKGCAIMEMGGFEKMLFGSGSGDTDDLKDHGLVTGYFSAVADA